MTDPFSITLHRSATRWQWSVTSAADWDDSAHGASSDYVKACADALAAYEALISARRSLT